MSVAQEMEFLLKAAFSPQHIDIINESHLHAGHSGDDGSGESHFSLVIVAPAFAGKSRVECHRMVHRALGGLHRKIHALSISARSA